jgi:hypothetical protein
LKSAAKAPVLFRAKWPSFFDPDLTVGFGAKCALLTVLGGADYNYNFAGKRVIAWKIGLALDTPLFRLSGIRRANINL